MCKTNQFKCQSVVGQVHGATKQKMDKFYFRRYAHLDRIWHPIILTTVVASTDFYYLLENGSLPFSDHAYVYTTLAMYFFLFLAIGNSVNHGRRKSWRVYFQFRLILLLAITSLVRIKETMITPPAPLYHIPSLVLDVIYILEMHFGSKAIIEVIEGEKYAKIRDTDMDTVFTKRWEFFGIRLKTLLLGQLIFSLQFFGFHVFYYFSKTRNPIVYEATITDIWYSTILLSLPFLCLAIFLNKSVLLYGIHHKSVRILTIYYYCKTVLVVSLRLVVVAMLHKEYTLVENTAFARTIAKLTLLPTGYIFQFEIAQVLRWITYFSLEADIPIGDHLPNFGVVEYSKGEKKFGFFQIAETNKHLMDFLNSVMVPKRRVVLGHKLGEGHFSNVYNAEIRRNILYFYKLPSKQVAVKVNKGEIFDALYFKSLCSELKTLQAIGSHEFLVKFIGVTKVNTFGKGSEVLHELGIISELCAEGDLLHYLRSSLAPQFIDMDGGKTVMRGFERIGITWAYQISSGMEFLSNRKIIHGDLAARNILLNDKLTCKISDFGMSFCLYTYQVYATSQQNALPYRWMAPETLGDFKFSIKSDIWSYGVLLWEIFSNGDEPYLEEIHSTAGDNVSFLQRRKNGNCLKKPDYCSSEIYDKVMKKCWEIDPSLRPDFGEFVEYFSRPLLFQ